MTSDQNFHRFLCLINGAHLVKWYPDVSLIGIWDGGNTIFIISIITCRCIDTRLLSDVPPTTKLAGNLIDIAVHV